MSLDIIKYAADGANSLGTLQVNALWALICMYLVYNLWQERKDKQKQDAVWQQIRMTDSAADAVNADALVKLADKLSELVTIINERLPRRN